jgi:hypothetical protein
MPNVRNIASPISLISPGRSGTTLLSAIFERHPGCSVCGETVDLVFDLWNAAQRSFSHITPELTAAPFGSSDDRTAVFVRQGFLSLLADNKTFWFHKPIGIPFSFSPALLQVDSWDERADSYWTVMGTVFPGAKCFTVLRHPWDIVLSYKHRFDMDEQTCWAVLGFLAHIIEHPKSMVRYAVSYEALVTDSDATLRSLLSFLGVPYHPDMREAFDTVHTRVADRESSCGTGFSWRDKWEDLNPQFAEERFVGPIRRLFAKFGYDLCIPANWLESPAPSPSGLGASQAESGEVSIDAQMAALRQHIEHLEMRAINMHAIWEERAIRQENEYHQSYLKLRAEITNLPRSRRSWGWVADLWGKISR